MDGIRNSRLPFGFRSGRLTRDVNVLCASFFEYIPRAVDISIIFRVDGNKDVTFLELSFVTLG